MDGWVKGEWVDGWKIDEGWIDEWNLELHSLNNAYPNPHLTHGVGTWVHGKLIVFLSQSLDTKMQF